MKLKTIINIYSILRTGVRDIIVVIPRRIISLNVFKIHQLDDTQFQARLVNEIREQYENLPQREQ